MASKESDTTVEFFRVSSGKVFFSLRKFSSKDEEVLMFVISLGPSIMFSFEAATLNEILEQLNRDVKVSDEILTFSTATFYIEVNDSLVDAPENFKELFFGVFARLKLIKYEKIFLGIDTSDKDVQEIFETGQN
ncbi:MAG: hypothetical protein U9N57_07110 [Pseudomonadota bacterium]|nr:hypothetical protein [Pseudomonadota bacterium]